MWKIIFTIGLFIVNINSIPLGHKKKNMAIKSDDMMETSSTVNERSEIALRTLNLPSNATSIRSDLVDNFSCEDKGYGYYADIDNDCQIFHVCLPVVYPDGKENLFRWSFICPEETVFSQDSFTCMREEDMAIGCEDSMKYYELNRNFGVVTESNEMIMNSSNEDDLMVTSSESKMNENEKNNKIEVVQKKPLNSYKKKPVRRPEFNQKQPIKKIQTTTMKIMEANESDVVTEKEMEKTTSNKYQRLTKRPELNNKKKMEQTKLEQRKKPITQQIILNTKRIEIPENSRITSIIEQQKPQQQQQQQQQQQKINAVTENILIETNMPLELNKYNDEFKMPLEKLKKKDELQETSFIKTEKIINNDNNEQLSKFTVITTENSILNNDVITESVILIKNQEQKPIKLNNEQKKENLNEFILNNDNIPIKEEEKITESMDDNNANNINISNNNKLEKDQQSMIINLISSLVNAENSKVEEETENKMENLDNGSAAEEGDLTASDIVPEVSVKIDESADLKGNEDKLQLDVEKLVKTESIDMDSSLKPMQSFNQMSHIPVKIISEDYNYVRSDVDDNLNEKILETNLDSVEPIEANPKPESIEEIIENNSQPEQYSSTENSENEPVTVKTNEILPIFFRTNQDANLNPDTNIQLPIDDKINSQIIEINQNPLNVNMNIDNLKARKFRNQMDSRKRRFLFRADAAKAR